MIFWGKSFTTPQSVIFFLLQPQSVIKSMLVTTNNKCCICNLEGQTI